MNSKIVSTRIIIMSAIIFSVILLGLLTRSIYFFLKFQVTAISIFIAETF